MPEKSITNKLKSRFCYGQERFLHKKTRLSRAYLFSAVPLAGQHAEGFQDLFGIGMYAAAVEF